MYDHELKNKILLNRSEQILFYSKEEYLRRRDAVIAQMKARDIRLLVIANPCEEAYGVWLANEYKCSFLMLDDGGELTVVLGCGLDTGAAPCLDRKTGDHDAAGAIPGVRYASGLDVQYAAQRVGANRRIGVINRGHLTKDFCLALAESAGELEWVDMRIPVGLIRAVRSPEEREAIRCTAQMHRRILNAAPAFIREGRLARDIVRDISACARDLGAGRDEFSLFIMECGLENTGEALPPRAATMQIVQDSDLRISKGFRILLMVEMNWQGGIVLDTGRNFSIGEPHPVTRRVFEGSVKAQKYVASLMKPGAIPSEIEKKASEYARELDINMLTWNLLHGLGNTKTELPDLRDDTTKDLPLLENMYLLCEPNTCIPYGDPAAPGFDPANVIVIPNTYLVTTAGGEKTVDFPDEIIVL